MWSHAQVAPHLLYLCQFCWFNTDLIIVFSFFLRDFAPFMSYFSLCCFRLSCKHFLSQLVVTCVISSTHKDIIYNVVHLVLLGLATQRAFHQSDSFQHQPIFYCLVAWTARSRYVNQYQGKNLECIVIQWCLTSSTLDCLYPHWMYKYNC